MAEIEKEAKIWLIPSRKIKPPPLNVNVIDHETVKFSRSLFSMNMASMLWLSRRPSRTTPSGNMVARATMLGGRTSIY